MEIRRGISLLFMLLVVIGCARGGFYTHKPSNLEYHTSTCRNHWCGEVWKAERILYYNYTVTESYKIQNVTVIVQTSDCSGTQNSLNCVPGRPVPTIKPERVRTETVSRALTEIIELPTSLSLGLIASDNINVTTRNFIEDAYPHNHDKIWQIKIPRGCQIVMYFSEFDLETTDSCQKDYFMIQTSKSQRNIPKYCSSLHRVEIKNRRRVQLWLHSDGTVAKRGIHAAFCFSNRSASASSLPCNCNLVSSRSAGRRQRSLEDDVMAKAYKERQHRRRLRQQTEEEVGEWLISMMRNGTQKVEEYLHNSRNPMQQYIAQKYQEALTAYGLNLDES